MVMGSTALPALVRKPYSSGHGVRSGYGDCRDDIDGDGGGGCCDDSQGGCGNGK